MTLPIRMPLLLTPCIKVFPSNVRDRIMKEAEEVEQKNQAKRKKKEKDQKQLDGSASDRGMGAGNSWHGSASGTFGRGSILGGLSVGSVGSRDSRASRRPTPTSSGVDQNLSREFGVPASRKSSMGAENPYGTQPIADHFNATVRATCVRWLDLGVRAISEAFFFR